MALLAEEIVEEWLNRNGYFTIRGAKIGVHEIDLLAVKPTQGGWECRHIEVQASINPISYITAVPKKLQDELGRKGASAKKRPDDELQEGIREWIEKKFSNKRKAELRSVLAPGKWSRELVVYNVKHDREVELLKKAGIEILKLSEILQEMNYGGTILEKASGASLVELASILMTPGKA